MKRLTRECCYMLSMLPKQGMAQSLFALPALMWLSSPVHLQVRYISPTVFAGRHSPEDVVPGFVSHQSTSTQ